MLTSQPSGAAPGRIGRYQVLRKIATGGMAELFLAKQVGLDGFEKLVAIKRILSHLAHDQDFVQMFQDEARIVANLSHPNIVQIYDLGKADDTYFIAMEYIDGRNLSVIAKQARASGADLSPAYIAHCMARACEGLFYAHTRHDHNDRPLHIVHRDVSPQNIIVSFAGSVKLVDFGIAKAATKIAHTRAGVLKGKYAYMSPEQIRGEPTDARSDLFAVGIVLYELLCGRRPFEKENSIQTLKSIVQDPAVPCRSLNPDIPEPLAAIIERCLAKKPDGRFQTAQEVQLVLEEFVSSGPQRVNSLAISQWVTGLFEDDTADRGRAVEDASEAIGPDGIEGEADREEDRDRPAALAWSDLPLSRGRGGGSISGAVSAPSRGLVSPFEGLEDAGPSRLDLIAEGVIERPDPAAAPAGWDQSPTVHLGAGGPGDEETVFQRGRVDLSESETRPAPAVTAGAALDAAAPLQGPRTTRTGPAMAMGEDEGLMAPLGGDAAFESGQDDPWDEATHGLPDLAAVERRPSNDRGARPAGGRAYRLAEVDGPEPSDTEASDPSHEIYAAARASGTTADEEPSWRPFEDADGVAALDDPWGDRTVADPGLFGDDEDAVYVRELDDEAEEAEEEVPFVADEDLQDVPEDPTVDQETFEGARDDATVSEAARGARSDESTLDGVVAAERIDLSGGATRVEAGLGDEGPTRFDDDRTVAYRDAFASDSQATETIGSGPERTIIAPPSMLEAPTQGLDGGLSSLEPLNDLSTVRDMSEEPELPLPRLGGGADLDGATVAAPPQALVTPGHGPDGRSGSGIAEAGLPAARSASSGRRGRSGPSGRRAVRRAGETEAATALSAEDELSTVGYPPRLPSPVPQEADSVLSLQFEQSAAAVRPQPLDAPPSEADQTSHQDEYSALVVPQPLGSEPASPPPGERAIGSTNVPPASLSLSEMLAHPPQVHRSKLSSKPAVVPAGPNRGRPPSLRSASMVGRQIREVVRSKEPPVIDGTRLPAAAPRLDLHRALHPEAPPKEPVAPPAARGRSWLAPVMAALSVVLLACAVYLALPYVTGSAGPHLTIKTTPVGARVLVDGALQADATPTTIRGLRPGVTYQIRLERSGFEPVDREVQLPEDGPLIWQIPLRPATR